MRQSSLALFLLLLASSVAGQQINEIRIDQPSSDIDEYFEISASSLDGLTYVVIGDSSADVGVIESVTQLDGGTVPPDGYFVVAESSFTLGAEDLSATLGFENSDNVTHLLVDGFTGAKGWDLDTDNNGTLDLTPWTEVVDCIALIETPGEGDPVYCPTTLGPLGVHVPFHAFRCSGGWHMGAEPTGLLDTPGEASDCCRVDPDCYYSTVDAADKDTLRASLHELLDSHVVIDFDDQGQSWALLEAADQFLGDPTGTTILDLYHNEDMAKVATGRPYAREHTWPQSYMPVGTLGHPRSDHHALFLADSSYNGSLAFDPCDPADSVPWPTMSNGGQGGATTPSGWPASSRSSTAASSSRRLRIRQHHSLVVGGPLVRAARQRIHRDTEDDVFGSVAF